MADLVALTDFLAYLDDPTADAQVADALLDAVEARLEADVGRSDRPFQAAQTDRTEVHDSTGCSTLYLDYPIGALTSVKLGSDPANPVETIAVDDPLVLVIGGDRTPHRLVRTGCRIFGCRGLPNYVQVVYDTLDDLPSLASLAVMEMAAGILRNRGSENLKSERIGGYSIDYALLAEQLPSWKNAVQVLAEVYV